MAKAKTAPTPDEWSSLTVGVTEKIVIGPVETLLAWEPGAKTGVTRLLFDWDDELLDELPTRLRPTLPGGHRGLAIDSVAAAKPILAELEAFLKKRHPKLTRKTFKSPYPMVRFIDGEDYWSVITHEQTAAEVIGDNEKPEGWTEPCGKDRVLLWNSSQGAETQAGTIYVRATDDEVQFVDDKEWPSGGTKVATLGTWTFESVLVAMPASQAVLGIDGVKTKSAAAVAALCAKESPRKIRRLRGDNLSIATIVKLEGKFRAESGGADPARWLRFVRV